MTVQIIPLRVNQIRLVVDLHSTTFIYFDALWNEKCVASRRRILDILIHYGVRTLFHVDINNDPDAEDYVINTLAASKLPALVYFQEKSTPFNVTWGIDQIVAFLGNTQSVQKILPFVNIFVNARANVDTIHHLFQDNVGTLFIAGDKSSVGKSTSCLCILSSLIRIGIPADSMAYIKPVTQCEAEQPITRYIYFHTIFLSLYYNNMLMHHLSLSCLDVFLPTLSSGFVNDKVLHIGQLAL